MSKSKPPVPREEVLRAVYLMRVASKFIRTSMAADELVQFDRQECAGRSLADDLDCAIESLLPLGVAK